MQKAPKFGATFVPKTGFEPAHPFGRYHLKVVRLPISPPGHFFVGEGDKSKKVFGT